MKKKRDDEQLTCQGWEASVNREADQTPIDKYGLVLSRAAEERISMSRFSPQNIERISRLANGTAPPTSIALHLSLSSNDKETAEKMIAGIKAALNGALQQDRPTPPVNAELVLHLLLSRDEREAVIGCLVEQYAKMHERFGERRAKLWFYAELARSASPLVRRLIVRLSGIALLGDWVRRMIS